MFIFHFIKKCTCNNRYLRSIKYFQSNVTLRTSLIYTLKVFLIFIFYSYDFINNTLKIIMFNYFYKFIKRVCQNIIFMIQMIVRIWFLKNHNQCNIMYFFLISTCYIRMRHAHSPSQNAISPLHYEITFWSVSLRFTHFGKKKAVTSIFTYNCQTILPTAIFLF